MKNFVSVILKNILPVQGWYNKYYYHRMRLFWLLKAGLGNQVFCCRALQGESNYNICINCDLTVSCNCQDFDGSGHIGSLREQPLAQIFHGAKAQGFRNALARRKFPISFCPICPELTLVPKEKGDACLTGYRLPHRGIMVENTVLCNLKCGLCRRGDLLSIRENRALSIEDVGKVADLLNEYKLESVYYFNLGEPFLPKDIYTQIKVIREKNPGIRIITSTNGMLLDTEDKLEAAMMMDYVYISLDGINQKMANRYQVGINFDKAYENMCGLVKIRNQRGALRPIVEWKYVLFRWNDRPQYVSKAIELAQAANVDLLAFYPGAGSLLERSLRYTWHPYFKNLGEKVAGVSVINFGKVPCNLILP